MRLANAFGSAAILLMALSDGRLHATESLNRSIYFPVEFELCEHLKDAVLYQDNALISSMPAERIFQFTYYPELEKILPEFVNVRIEGRYVEDDEAFVAKLAVSPSGVHSAHRTRGTSVVREVEKQKSKIDVRLAKKTILLRCPRVCKRESGDDAARSD